MRLATLPAERPRTRGDCAGVPRPCPFAGECRYGLPDASSPDATCSLDVTDQHPDGMTLDEVATLLGFSGEHVRRIEEKAIEKLWRVARRLTDDGEAGEKALVNAAIEAAADAPSPTVGLAEVARGLDAATRRLARTGGRW